MPTYPEKMSALKLRSMEARLRWAREQIKRAVEDCMRFRSAYMEERELRHTSIKAAEKAIRRLRKGRDNARAELAALKAAHSVESLQAPYIIPSAGSSVR